MNPSVATSSALPSATGRAVAGCQFASDNTAGMCPEAWQALAEANAGSLASYGNDLWTARACDLVRDVFEYPAEVFFVFNGTAANSLAIAAMCQSYHAILCHELAHVETDECGAPEFFSNGTKLLLLDGNAGKLTPDGITHAVERRQDVHYPKPRVVSITQATELSAGGTACGCTWTGPDSPMPSRLSACLPGGSPGRLAWTCSAWAARRMAWAWATPSSSSGRSWPRSSPIAASRRGNSPPRCDT
jgi:hypothetical protein